MAFFRCDGGEPHFSDPEGGEGCAEQDVAGGSEEGEEHVTAAFKIAHIGASGEAEDVEERDQADIAVSIVECEFIGRAEEEAECLVGADEHQEGNNDPDGPVQEHAPFEAFLYTVVISGTEVLGDHNGDRTAAAVTEGVGKAFNSCCCRVCGDPGGPECVDAALDEDLTDIQAGGLQGGDQTEMERLRHEFRVNS